MKNVIISLLLLLPALATAEAYKCTVNGVTKYQADPCQSNPEAVPLTLKIPSPELLAKMRSQERARDEYWSRLKQIESLERQAREHEATAQDAKRRREIANARADQSWREYQQDRFNSECSRLASQNIQGEDCPPISHLSSVKLY